MLARSVLFMQPRDGRREDLVAAFQRLGIPQAALAQEGCLSVELQVPADEAAPVLVTALWSDRDKYDGWLTSPSREETRDELFSLLTEPPEGVVYDIRVAAGDPVPAGSEPA